MFWTRKNSQTVINSTHHDKIEISFISFGQLIYFPSFRNEELFMPMLQYSMFVYKLFASFCLKDGKLYEKKRKKENSNLPAYQPYFFQRGDKNNTYHFIRPEPVKRQACAVK